MNASDFLHTVVSTKEGWFLLASRDADTGWHEEWHDWTCGVQPILESAREHVETNRDVYFSAHLFSEKVSRKHAVLPTRTVQADLDNAEVMSMPVIPTVVVETSPLRHQGYWVLKEPMEPGEIERLARRIAYGVRDCDRTGWPLGHRMRLPGTRNFKYLQPSDVDVSGHTLSTVDPETFNLFPELTVPAAQAEADADWISQGHIVSGVPPLEIMKMADFPNNIMATYNKTAKDRSKELWKLMQTGFRHGLDKDQVYEIVSLSPNNKFRDDRRYNAVADLRKDIMRAEAVANDKILDVKAQIMELRMRRDIPVHQRRMAVSAVVMARMREDGELIHTRGGQLWFLRKDTGRPVELSLRSRWLDAYMTKTFGLNMSEQDSAFVKNELVAHVRNQAAVADLSVLSYYDATTKTMLLHTGGRDVLHVRAHSVEIQPNGYAHAVFKTEENVETFKLGRVEDLKGVRWHDFLFAPQMEHIDGMLTQEEAVCLLRAWFLFLLFRSQMTNRPILAIMGEPGAGKSTTGKKIYRLLYGRLRSIATLEDIETFNTETINLPFVCYDGVDSYERWIPQVLSLAASVTERTKRVLFTDSDTITERRQAMVMLTTHNPKFTREDVVDRLLIIMLRRLPYWLPENRLLEEVSAVRNALWADIVQDIQNILRTPDPAHDEVPQFRIEDFAYYGMWFSKSNGTDDIFRGAIGKLVNTQRGVNLETDQILVAAIDHWVSNMIQHGHQPAFTSQTVLYNHLVEHTHDPLTFTKVYKNPQTLGRKMVTLRDSLKQVFDIEMEYDAGIGARKWKIAPKADAIPLNPPRIPLRALRKSTVDVDAGADADADS